MNTPKILSTLSFASLVAAHAAVSPIHMDVEQVSKTETKGSKGGGGKGAARPDPMGEKTQHKELKIKLANNSNDSFSSLVVKYWFFGRDMKGHEIDVMKQGERKCSLGPRATEVVESEQVTSSYVEEHNKPAQAGGKGGAAPKATKVPASGQKLTGYVVKVLNEGNVVAEFYSEDGLKKKLSGGDAK